MLTRTVACDNKTCPPFESVVDTLSSGKYAAMVEEYCAIAKEDPAYLTYHCMSVALRVQYELKLKDFPSLMIGGCMSRFPKACCLVEALKEAIEQRSAHITEPQMETDRRG